MNRAYIKAISSYVPESVLTNEQLAVEFPDFTAEKIFAKTGIWQRHISGTDECASDLGVAAAKRLFESGDHDASDVDFLLFCTQSPDHFLPTTACLIQDRLGLPTSCGAIDINQGCSGFVYGLSLAKSLIESGTANNVLLITADTYSKIINPRDKSLRILFGDGAAATLVGSRDSDRELIGPFVFGSDGSRGQTIIVPAGGFRNRKGSDEEKEDEQGNWRSDRNLFMDGGAVFDFTLRTVPDAVGQLLEKAGIGIDEIDHFIPHQANKFMLDRLRIRLKIPAEKFFCDLEKTANTVSSTIPIAYEQARAEGKIAPRNRVALIGFGVGLSWAATLVDVV